MAEKVERIILIAEDDPEALVSWKQDIKEYNRDANNPVQFTPEYASTKVAATRVLERLRIDCAVIDLRLPVDDKAVGQSSQATGNDILQKVLLETAVPAVVYSGYTEEASELVKSSQIRIIEKKIGGGIESLQWLAQHEGLMAAMAAMRRRVERESARLFSQSIWPRWEKAWNTMTDVDALAGVITRQVVAHVAEELSLPPNFHHPEEFYFVPPLSAERLGTGDMVRVEGAVYVVVTPRCNMARDNYPKHLTFALCKPMGVPWTGLRERFAGNEKKQEKALEELRSYATQGHSTSTHFLPPCGDEGPWLVDFREVMSVPSEPVAEMMKSRFASIASQFVPNLVQRYAAYLGRIGQPDLDCDVLRAIACK